MARVAVGRIYYESPGGSHKQRGPGESVQALAVHRSVNNKQNPFSHVSGMFVQPRLRRTGTCAQFFECVRAGGVAGCSESVVVATGDTPTAAKNAGSRVTHGLDGPPVPGTSKAPRAGSITATTSVRTGHGSGKA